MCTCASCEYTDGFADKGFAEWPKGEPAGKRASDSAYSAHAAHGRQWGHDASGRASLGPAVPDEIRRIVPEPRYPRGDGLVMPITPAPKWLHDWINRKGAQPEAPASAPSHFPEPDRKRPETAVIYDMRKDKEKPEEKKPRGRPPTGKPFLVRLEPEQVKRAQSLGAGNISAGVRKALDP